MKNHPIPAVSIFLVFAAFFMPDLLMAQFIRFDTSFYSPSLKETRNMTVFLPDDYFKDQVMQYSTIYYLHGWGGNHESLNSSHERLNEMLESGAINPVIIVCADNSALPFGSGVYVNSVLTGNFEDYVAFDVVDWVEENFRAIPGKNARALFGQSLGAYGAFWIGIQHNDRFRAISAHAGHVNNNVWLPAVRLMLMIENDDPPYYYDFFGFNMENPFVIPGFFTKSMFLAASGFSPNESSGQTYINPRIVDYPFDEWGNIIDTVYNKWKSYDIALAVSNLEPADSLSILYGCGTNDETMAYIPNLTLRDSLIQNGLSFEFLSHKGGHDMPDVYLNRTMIFLDSLLMHPSVVTMADQDRETSRVTAFPNPAKDYVSIRLLPGETDAVVSLTEVSGKVIDPACYPAVRIGQHLHLNLNGCSKGVYLIDFRSACRTGCVKLLVTE